MPNTVKTATPDFVIDSSRDRYYRLLISDHPDTRPFIHDIALENLNEAAVRKLADPAAPQTVLESLLIPTNGGETVSVVVGTTVVGTLPDPTVVSDSQIARVYASGLIPTCKLVLTPAEQPLAHISLYISDGGVPFNNPPTNPWALLPDGSMWRVEPTRYSPFRNIQDESRVLVELRVMDEIIFVYLDGRECGILDLDAADALRGAVQTAVKDGFIPVARGCVERHDDDTISLHINALAFPLWRREDFRLRHNPMSLLVPYQRNPLLYRAGLQQFIRCHERVPNPTPTRNHTMVAGLRRYAPLALILLAILSFVLTVSGGLSPRGTVGLLGISVVFGVLGLWIMGCRKYDTTVRKQPRRWEMTLPLALSVLIPSVTFASVGIFHDTDTRLNSTVSAQSTTLSPFPHPRDLLSTLADGQPADPTSPTKPASRADRPGTPRPSTGGQDILSSAPSVTPTLTTPADQGALPRETSSWSPDASAPLIWAGGAEVVSPDTVQPLPPTADTPPRPSAPTLPAPLVPPVPPVPSVPLVPRNPALPDTVTITLPVPDTPQLPNRVFLPGPIDAPDFEVPVWPEEPPVVDPPQTNTSPDPLDTRDVKDPQDPQGFAPAVPDTTSPTIPTTPAPEDPLAELTVQEEATPAPSTGEQSPPGDTDITQP